MPSLCVILRRSPYGSMFAAEALRHTNGAVANGLHTTLLLMGDGVYLAKEGQQAGRVGWTSLSEVLRATVTWQPPSAEDARAAAQVCIQQSALVPRGLDPLSLVPGVAVVSDAEVAQLLSDAQAVMVF